MKTTKLMALILAMTLGLTPAANAASQTAQPTKQAYTIHEAYQYPITPDDPEWFATDSHLDRVNYCQIPEDILANMDTEALVQTIADYPLLVDVLLFNTADEAYTMLKSNFNAIGELETRPNASSTLKTFISTNKELANSFIRQTAMQIIALSISQIVNDTELKNKQNTQQDYENAYKFYPELNPNHVQTLATAPAPTTPDGKALELGDEYHYDYPELSDEEIKDLDKEMDNTYHAQRLASTTKKI